MINIIDKIKPLGDFPIADACDIQVDDKRLDVVLKEKVNSEHGKGLSTNDYSDVEKKKVDELNSMFKLV